MLAILLAALESEADKQKFTDIYEQYHPQMEQTALRILKNQHDAEDAMQNAFMQIIRHFEKIDEIPCEKLPFWIVCIVKNEAVTILRKNQRTVQLENWDSFAADAESTASGELTFEPTARYQRQMAAMLKDPLKWERRRARPLWKNVAQKAAVILLVFSLSLGSLMAVSPTVRAAVVRWVTEWYETHVVYRFSGEQLSGEMPQYEITNLPEGYVEDERVDWPTYISIIYRKANDENAPWIYLRYVYMQQGTVNNIGTEGADIIPVTVNGIEGQLYLARNPDESDSTITWIDPDKNIAFVVDAALDADSILHIAESVSLVKTEK